MLDIIWITFGGLLTLLTLPVVIELSLFTFANVAARLFPRKETAKNDSSLVRRIALLIPAHNEESTIARSVGSLLAAEKGELIPEVIVIADNCDDQTAAVARAAGARVLERHDTSVRGKGAALNFAITTLAAEKHDAYIIIDADTVVESNFLVEMGRHFALGKQAIQCTYLVLNVDSTPRIRLMNLALLSMNQFRPMGREVLGASVGIMGNGFGLTRALLEQVPYTANSITEDLEYHLKLISHGHRVRFVSSTRVLADFPVSKQGTETQRARWEGGRFLLQRQFFLPLLEQVLRGRFRMVEPLMELMSLPLAYEVLLLVLLAVLPGQGFVVYSLVAFGVIALQSALSVLFYGRPRDFLAFLEIPGYLFWKIVSLPRTLWASRKNAAWIRTKRD